MTQGTHQGCSCMAEVTGARRVMAVGSLQPSTAIGVSSKGPPDPSSSSTAVVRLGEAPPGNMSM
jgi:hypothetical protein